MVSFKEKFKFLEDGVDFPFYNDTPKLSTVEWLVLLIPVIIILILLSIPELRNEYRHIIICLIMLIPALYVCKGDYSLFFKKPRKKDIPTIIFCVIANYVYAIAIAAILQFLNYNIVPNAVLSEFSSPSVFLIISSLMQLVGEEFFKIFLLLILMYVVYKLTNNRGLSIALGVIITLTIFGLSHYRAYNGRILQILLLQGFGSIFDLYAYMKTKNVVVSYIVHVIIDYIPFILMMLGST